MSDIVERLRASIHFKAYAGDAHEQIICGQQMREAAAEIERLRQRLTEAEIACDSWKREAELNQQAADEAAGYAHRLAEAEALLRDIANREFADEEECAASAERCLKLMTSDSASVVQENSR